MYIVFGLLLFGLSVIARIWVRSARRDFGIDTWYFLNYAEGLRRQKRIPVKLKHYLLDIEEQWYPPVTALLVSLLPKKLADRYHWVISAVVDSIQATVLYIFSILSTGRFDISVAAALLYITSTVNSSMSSNLNARPLASLISSLLMLALYNYTLTPGIHSLAIVLLLGALLLHTHKMATQQLLFFIFGLTILTQNIHFLYILCLIFIISFIITGGFYAKILRNNIQIVRYWVKNLPYLGKHQVYESPLYKNGKSGANRMGVSGIKAHKIMSMVAKSQLLLFLAIIIVFWVSKRNDFHVKNISFIFFWSFINYFTVISTTYLPIFKFIGEGFKYLIYGAFPASFLVSCGIISLSPNPFIAYGILGFLIAVNLFIQVFTLNRQFLNTGSYADDELKNVIGILKESKEDNVMCIPVYKAEPVAYLAGKKVLWGGHGSGWDSLNDFFPVIRVPLEALIKKYKVSFLLLDKRFADIEDLRINEYIKIIFDGKHYTLAMTLI